MKKQEVGGRTEKGVGSREEEEQEEDEEQDEEQVLEHGEPQRDAHSSLSALMRKILVRILRNNTIGK